MQCVAYKTVTVTTVTLCFIFCFNPLELLLFISTFAENKELAKNKDNRLENETVWLTQAQMSELFQTDRTSIVRHISNIYKVDELDRESTCVKIAQVQTEGKREVKRTIPYFNLDMIISVGYRVNSKRGIKFRQWANRILKEYLVKGYAVNERIRARGGDSPATSLDSTSEKMVDILDYFLLNIC